MILHRLGHLLATFGNSDPGRHAAGEHGSLWRRVARDHPEILPDLIRQGGLLAAQPRVMGDPRTGETYAEPLLAPLDPHRLSYEAGRRDMALQLLSAAGLTHDDLNKLFKEQDYD